MINTVRNVTTGTVHAVTIPTALAARPGPQGIPTVCGRTVATREIERGDIDTVSCGDCRSHPLHLPLYSGYPLRPGDRVVVDGRHRASVRAVSPRHGSALVTPDGSTDDVQVDLQRLERVPDASTDIPPAGPRS